MRKDRKKKQKNSSKTLLFAVACLLLGLLFTAAYLFAGDTGFLHGADLFERYLLGKGAFLLPLALFAAAGQLFVAEQLCVFNKKTLLFVLVMLCLLGTAHHVFVPFGSELLAHQLQAGGGLVGGILILILHRTIGIYMTTLVLILGWLAFLVLLLPLQSWWERWQDRLTADELTLVRPEEKPEQERKSGQQFAPKVFKNTPTPRTVTPAPRVVTPAAKPAATQSNTANTVAVYRDEEFGAFTEGLQRPGTIKRILGLNSEPAAYSEPAMKEQLANDPVQLPEWEEHKTEVILRPIIDYGDNDDDYVPDKRFLDEAGPAIPVAEAEPAVQAPGEQETEVPEQENIENTAAPAEEQKSAAELAIPVREQENSQKIEIYNSADRVQTQPAATQETAAESCSAYRLPPLELLDMPKRIDPASYQKDIMDQCAVLEQTLTDFKVRAKVIAVTRGPSVTRFELEPAPGVKVSSVVNLADDIALRLAAPGVRIEAPIPGKSAIGIEAPNTKNDTVCLREVVEDASVRTAKESLYIGLGKDISGEIISADLAKMPHLLVAGSTGSGKSVCINTIIAGLLYRANPDEVKLILVDPKVVELSNYNGIPHLLTPVVTEPKKAASALHWAVAEMERRYKAFADSHVRDIKSYNVQAQEKMPYIVIIIDELSDLMMVAKVDVEDAILRLAQKARAAGIHLILATQRPSVDVITGIVKANIPSRIAFAVSSQTDSRTIIDMGGAEKLLGKGDMLFYPMGYNKPVRVQGAFVSDAELNKIVDFIVKQSIPVNYSEEVTQQELECDSKGGNSEEAGAGTVAEDELFADALNLVLDMGQASSSMLQRRFRIGYTRAARLVDTMEELGIVGQSVGSKPREVIISRKEAEERFLHRE